MATYTDAYGLLMPEMPDQVDETIVGLADNFDIIDGAIAAAAAGPVGPAGGDLSGTYPDPAIAAGSIDNSHIASDAAIAASKLDLDDYILKSDFNKRVLGVGLFVPIASSTPDLVYTGPANSKVGALAYDATTSETAGVLVDFPPGWTTFKATIIWFAGTTATDHVVWQCDIATTASGATLGAFNANLVQSTAPGVANRLVSVEMFTNASVPAAGSYTSLRVVRLPANTSPADDFSTDAYLYGVLLERVS